MAQDMSRGGGSRAFQPGKESKLPGFHIIGKKKDRTASKLENRQRLKSRKAYYRQLDKTISAMRALRAAALAELGW